MRALYYIIHWTWGIVENIIGGLIYLFLLCLGNKPQKYRNGLVMVTEYDWGGAFSMGMFIFLGKNANSCLPHEYGHSIQMMWWGPLWLFVVAIPSGIRFWYREWYWKYRYPKTHKSLKPYDSIWFEGQATELGKKANTNCWKWL